MIDLTHLVSHWGYLAIFVVIVLGNIGVPVPEEAVLVLAGLLVWKEKLWLPSVLIVGILSAVLGDNFGYWVGRRYGRAAINRYGQRLFITSERLDATRKFLNHHGQLGVFLARFIPGVRFMAGPLTGIAGMPFGRFFVANIAGAAVYVPLIVALGYAIGLGFADYVYQLEHSLVEAEHIVLCAILIVTLISLAWRVFKFTRLHQNRR
jgi:membrane protein DedA with SNARE-associated domain